MCKLTHSHAHTYTHIKHIHTGAAEEEKDTWATRELAPSILSFTFHVIPFTLHFITHYTLGEHTPIRHSKYPVPKIGIRLTPPQKLTKVLWTNSSPLPNAGPLESLAASGLVDLKTTLMNRKRQFVLSRHFLIFNYTSFYDLALPLLIFIHIWSLVLHRIFLSPFVACLPFRASGPPCP